MILIILTIMFENKYHLQPISLNDIRSDIRATFAKQPKNPTPKQTAQHRSPTSSALDLHTILYHHRV